jgi:hypothetical protein
MHLSYDLLCVEYYIYFDHIFTVCFKVSYVYCPPSSSTINIHPTMTNGCISSSTSMISNHIQHRNAMIAMYTLYWYGDTSIICIQYIPIMNSHYSVSIIRLRWDGDEQTTDSWSVPSIYGWTSSDTQTSIYTIISMIHRYLIYEYIYIIKSMNPGRHECNADAYHINQWYSEFIHITSIM